MSKTTIQVTYDEARAAVNACPNTAAGIRNIRPFADALYPPRARWPITLHLEPGELALLTAIRPGKEAVR